MKKKKKEAKKKKDCFYFSAVVSNASMNMSVQIAVQHPTFSSLEYIPRRVIARSYSNLISDILRNYHPVFHNSCTILHSTSHAQGFQFLLILPT